MSLLGLVCEGPCDFVTSNMCSLMLYAGDSLNLRCFVHVCVHLHVWMRLKSVSLNECGMSGSISTQYLSLWMVELVTFVIMSSSQVSLSCCDGGGSG